jgi:hypothetical protein
MTELRDIERLLKDAIGLLVENGSPSPPRT